MKAILKFNLPEETEEHEDCLNGWKYRKVISDLKEKLRQLQKYENIETIEIDSCRNIINSLLEEMGLTNENI